MVLYHRTDDIANAYDKRQLLPFTKNNIMEITGAVNRFNSFFTNSGIYTIP